MTSQLSLDGPDTPAPAGDPDAKPWQKGFALDRLKEISAVFKEHDKGLILGAFTGYKETRVAEALERGWLHIEEDEQGVLAAMEVEPIRRVRTLKDFSGRQVSLMEPGDLLVRRFAYTSRGAGAIRRLFQGLEAKAVWCWAWVEHPEDQILLHKQGYRWQATAIRASSELVGLYLKGEGNVAATGKADLATLERIREGLDVKPLVDRLGGAGLSFADHYSSYNKGHSWSALALRGFGGQPDVIEKPAEMSRKWKKENEAALGWECEDTPLRKELPEAEPLIAAIPGEHERIRLMRLSPGGGELERHADITDKDAGTADGRLMRIHIPLVTNPDVRFTGWTLQGQQLERHMAEGEAWYLDTRKPHRAVNGGDAERLHLVLDTHSSPALRALL